MISALRVYPWFSIWLRPRATVRQIIQTQPLAWTLVIVALASINTTLSNFRLSVGLRSSLIAEVAPHLLVGALFAILIFYLQVYLLQMVGSRLGGKASFEEIQAAVAWSRGPVVWALPLWAAKIAIFGPQVFPQGAMPRINISGIGMFFRPLGSSPNEAILFGALNVLIGVMGIWGLVILLNCLAEVQGFSIWKAFQNLLLAALVVTIPVGLFLLANLTIRP
ncbi:MAG TPA: hypothetical protein DE036_06700 [Actinobacteria bacterium]|nr:hypothetical protein [Actinomycetota bacterium]